MSNLPCGHWNKDWRYGEGKLSSVVVWTKCKDCGLELSPSPDDVKQNDEKVQHEQS